jgi:hypothetical protein
MTELFNEYPKAVNIRRKNKHGKDVFVPLVYPEGHLKHGQYVILENARAEADYDGTGVPVDMGPEMQSDHSRPGHSYNDYWQDWALANKSEGK